MINFEDTIAAISTAYGEGGIGIVRISGEKSLEILNKIFVSKGALKNKYLTYGKIVDYRKGSTVDEVMAVYMKGPHTYTAEDVVEINCHGSMVSLNKTLELILASGARLAEPGEFTERAFFNGRLDLSQAEAVIDLIKAKTEKSFDVALSQLEGSVSYKVNEVLKLLLDIQVEIAVNIDYPDEDIEELTYNKLIGDTETAISMVKKILEGADAGRLIRDGLNVAIVGRPNVGKSSLLNCLLRENRAIVTDIPGTTRDTIEETVNIRNIPVNLIDTAGIRETEDEIERIGIEKSKDAFNKADYVIMVVDGSENLTDSDLELIEYINSKKSMIIINKADKESLIDFAHIKSISPNSDIVVAALINGTGLDEIEDIIESNVYGGKVSQGDSAMVNNVRHIDLLNRALASLNSALNAAKMGSALDFAECDIRDAYDFLGEITGNTVSDDVINEVFSRFCLGK